MQPSPYLRYACVSPARRNAEDLSDLVVPLIEDSLELEARLESSLDTPPNSQILKLSVSVYFAAIYIEQIVSYTWPNTFSRTGWRRKRRRLLPPNYGRQAAHSVPDTWQQQYPFS